MLAAVLTTPLPDHRREADAGRQLGRQLREQSGRRLRDRLRRRGLAASRRARARVVSSPVAVSTTAALMPLPPTSMPIISMPGLRACCHRAGHAINAGTLRRARRPSARAPCETGRMQLGMIGLGRMGANIVRRLMRDGHECVVYDLNEAAIAELEGEGAIGARSLEEFASKLTPPRAAWIMVPAAFAGARSRDVAGHFERGDIIIDGGNSYYRDDLDRAAECAARGIHFVDVGTSGGVFGLERGYCLMIGGEEPDRRPPRADLPHARAGRRGGGAHAGPPRARRAQAEHGYLHCGGHGAGHFVKMVHNGIEYGIMGAIAEGLAILKKADVGLQEHDKDAETAPLRDPEYYQYRFDMRRDRRGLAPRQRDRLVAARPDGRGPAARIPTARASPAASRTRARGAGRRSPRSRRACPRTSSRRRCTSASARAARPTTPTSCSRRCASSSAGTRRSPRVTVDRGRARNVESAFLSAQTENLAAVRSSYEAFSARRPRRSAGHDGRRHRLAPGPGPGARRRLPRPPGGARRGLRPDRRAVVGELRRRALGAARRRRPRGRDRPLHRPRQGHGQAARRARSRTSGSSRTARPCASTSSPTRAAGSRR